MNPSLEHLKLWSTIGLLLVGGVIYLSLIPVPQSLQLDWRFADKLQHALVYAVLMLWFAQLTVNQTRLFAALLLTSLGIILEFLQGMTAYRQLDIFDMAANTLGVLLGLYAASRGLSDFLVTFEQRIRLPHDK